MAIPKDNLADCLGFKKKGGNGGIRVQGLKGRTLKGTISYLIINDWFI